MNNDDNIILSYVRQICSQKPYLLPKIIDFATEGVKDFANKQSDVSSKLTFMMSQVLSEMPDKNQFGPFSRKEILDRMDCLKGTIWHNKELEKLNTK